MRHICSVLLICSLLFKSTVSGQSRGSCVQQNKMVVIDGLSGEVDFAKGDGDGLLHSLCIGLCVCKVCLHVFQNQKYL